MEYEVVIGLEVHCQLNTSTKAFCGCSSSFGSPANENVCAVCLALPGTLPVLNKVAVESAIKLGRAVKCDISSFSYMARKNYFYPDLPKGYQISQSDLPICLNGSVSFLCDGYIKHVRLTRIHLEEDAGKSIHDIGEGTYIDANRCGVPLLEIVSEPDIRSPKEASAYLEKIRQLIRYLEISDGNMEEGSLRCDANISIRKKGETAYGTRTEVKNMNSFKSVEKAIFYEESRQVEILQAGDTVRQETRLWDADRQETRSMRGKEDAHDYRYFPDPDIAPISIDTTFIKGISLPELPEQREVRYVSQYGLPDYDASVITADKFVADYFEETIKYFKDAKVVSNWVMGEVMRALKDTRIPITSFPIKPHRLASLIELIHTNVISNSLGKQVFEWMIKDNRSPKDIISEKGLAQISDESSLDAVLDDVLSQCKSQLETYKKGKTKLFGFFIGEAMKKTKGKANPKILNKLLKEKLKLL